VVGGGEKRREPKSKMEWHMHDRVRFPKIDRSNFGKTKSKNFKKGEELWLGADGRG
jgi:hypothetical protein